MWFGLLANEILVFIAILLCLLIHILYKVYCSFYVSCPVCQADVSWYGNKNTAEDKTYTIYGDEWDETSGNTRRNKMISYEVKKSLCCSSCKHTFLSSFGKKKYSKWEWTGESFNAKECKHCKGGRLKGYTMDSFGDPKDSVYIRCVRCNEKGWYAK